MEINKASSKLEIATLFFLFVFITYSIPFIPGHLSDNTFWISWTTHIYNNGLSKAYHSGTDYLPLYQYFLFIFGRFFKSTIAIENNIYYLRCFTLAFDFLGLWFVYKWIDKRVAFFLVAGFSILNISYSYNTVLWGQVDGILSTLIFISIYYAWKKKMILSSIFLVLAINLKLQAVIFLPIWGLLYLNYAIERKRLKSFLIAILSILLVQLLILLPFMFEENGLQMILNVITNSVGRYPRISMNAFNFWHLVIYNPWDRTDDETVLGINFKTIGLVLFCMSSFIALFPLIKRSLFNLKDRTQIDRELLWLTCSLIAIFFFFFNTQMHERYCHPAFIFITAYAFYSKDFLPYILFSIAYFLNMEKVLKVLNLNNYSTFIFESKLIATVFLITIVILLTRLYKPVNKLERKV